MVRLVIVVLSATLPGGWAAAAQAHDFWRHRSLIYPYVDRDPANPGLTGTALPDPKVTRGLMSYRPVEPMPWGDVNKNIAPQPGAKAPMHEGH